MRREGAREWTRGLYRRWLPPGPDAHTTYLHLARVHCPLGGRVVDLGCGEEDYLAELEEVAGELVGVDARPVAGRYGRYLQADLEGELPLEPGSVDLAACKFLLEHLEDPVRFMRAVREALVPGGRFLVLTANVLYYPYAANFVLSRLLSQEARMRLVGRVSGRRPGEIFPVRYRCNTPGALRAAMEGAGYEVQHLRTYPDYLVSAVNRPLGAMAVAYEKAVALLGLEGAGGFMVAMGGRR
ncbi:MAG: class I SAM-dependent methyltransferase [Actinomycetota bacterium]|nr:class I SAM-dependent methyltransferase [Actinomycetota bacterium]